MNKNFLITGATSGLGKEFCLLISDIAKGIVIVGRNKNKIIKLEKKINKLNPKIKVLPIVADLSKNIGLKKIFEIFAKQKKI